MKGQNNQRKEQPPPKKIHKIKKERKWDKRIEDTFPASDPPGGY